MDLLTADEHAAIEMAGALWGLLCKITGDDTTREADLRELIIPIHAIQRTVMAQAAARHYPSNLRLLGEVIPGGTDG